MFKKITLLFNLLAIVTPSQTWAFPGETRKYFQDWLVVCQNSSQPAEIRGVCRANTGVRNKKLFPYGDGTIFQLTLQRQKNSNYHIEFYHTLEDKYPSNRVTFKIDNHPDIKLNVMTEGNLAKLSHEQSKKLVALIKPGRWLTISYISQAGKSVRMRVSLRGSTASTLFIDDFYQRGNGKYLK